MYSEEIKRLLELKKHYLSVKEYIEVCNSPQVSRVKYENDVIKVWTDDNYYFELKLKLK